MNAIVTQLRPQPGNLEKVAQLLQKRVKLAQERYKERVQNAR